METNLRWPVQRLQDGRAAIYKPLDKATELQMDSVTNLTLAPRDNAVVYMLSHWDDYWHFGQVPPETEKEQYEGRDTNEAHLLVARLFSAGADTCSQAQASSKNLVVCAASTISCPV